MIGSGELIVILCIALLLFGGKRLPEFARNLGKGIREFKKACSESDEETIEVVQPKLDEKKTVQTPNSNDSD
jgi:sec-independent protein translocase protein TatA